MGVGETVAFALAQPALALRFGDLGTPAVARRKLRALRAWLADLLADLGVAQALPAVDTCAEVFAAVAAQVRTVDSSTLERMMAAGRCVFEGAQGVLLDEWRGFHPYTTWSTTTFANAVELAGPDVYRLGVLRCFTTRHGAGPLVTEDQGLTGRLVDPHNHPGPWQGAFRVGHFDTVAHRYALEVAGGIDALALTSLDLAISQLRICHAYRMPNGLVTRLRPGPARDLAYQTALTAQVSVATPVLDDAPRDWVAAVEAALDVPVALTSHGPTAADKRPRDQRRTAPSLGWARKAVGAA
jgi:adenylosuccinate synthase